MIIIRLKTESSCARGASEISWKEVNYSCVCSPFTPALSHPPRSSAPFCLWPEGCYLGTCQQKAPWIWSTSALHWHSNEGGQSCPIQSYALCCYFKMGLLGKALPNRITFRVFSPGSPLDSLHSLCVAKMCSVHTRKRWEATREHQVNLTLTSQQHFSNSAEKPCA